MAQKVLIVDDEESIVTLLQYNIERAGFETETAFDGLSGLQKALQNTYDMIVLDLMLPELDGTEVCKQLRQKQIDTPILMLTARDEELDKVLGLELGADDYLTKPFSPKEVVARIKAILRRTNKSDNYMESGEIKIAGLSIFPDQYEASINGESLSFTRKEFELLLYLSKNKGRVMSEISFLAPSGTMISLVTHVSWMYTSVIYVKKLNRIPNILSISKRSVVWAIKWRSRNNASQFLWDCRLWIAYPADLCGNRFYPYANHF